MDDAPRKLALLHDALALALADPGASLRWHRLHACLAQVDDVRQRAAVLDRVAAEAPADGVAGFLLQDFLAGVSGDAARTALAGQAALSIAPLDAQRNLSFCHLAWGQAIAASADREDFVAALRLARVPELMTATGRHLAALPTPRPAPRAADAVRRIALIAPMLAGGAHPPTVMAFQQAHLLREAGYEVWMFSGQELQIRDLASHLGCPNEIAVTPAQVQELAALAPPGLKVSLADAEFSLMRRWQEHLQLLAAYDPDLIVFVGLNSPLMVPLHAARPVLAMCVHAVAPMAPADVWLCADPALAGQDTRVWGESLAPARAHYHPYRIAHRRTQPRCTRALLGVDEDALLLVTVGARLSAEIHVDWAAQVLAVLAAHPKAVWLLVGGNAVLPPALAAAAPGQVRCLPHVDGLDSLLACCDLYLNPPRLGGGLSVAEAMAEGVAVLSLRGGDGGSKLGELAVADTDDYFDRLRALCASRAARQALGAALRAHFVATLDLAQSLPSLRAACELALARFRQRVGAA